MGADFDREMAKFGESLDLEKAFALGERKDRYEAEKKREIEEIKAAAEKGAAFAREDLAKTKARLKEEATIREMTDKDDTDLYISQLARVSTEREIARSRGRAGALGAGRRPGVPGRGITPRASPKTTPDLRRGFGRGTVRRGNRGLF